MVADKTKLLVLTDLRRGMCTDTIAHRHKVPVYFVRAVKSARLDVAVMLRSGIAPAVVFANYGDLLTREECGL